MIKKKIKLLSLIKWEAEFTFIKAGFKEGEEERKKKEQVVLMMLNCCAPLYWSHILQNGAPNMLLPLWTFFTVSEQDNTIAFCNTCSARVERS